MAAVFIELTCLGAAQRSLKMNRKGGSGHASRQSLQNWIEKYIQIGSELSSAIIQTELKDFQISKSPAEGQYTNQYILMGILVKFVKGEQLCV